MNEAYAAGDRALGRTLAYTSGRRFSAPRGLHLATKAAKNVLRPWVKTYLPAAQRLLVPLRRNAVG